MGKNLDVLENIMLNRTNYFKDAKIKVYRNCDTCNGNRVVDTIDSRACPIMSKCPECNGEGLIAEDIDLMTFLSGLKEYILQDKKVDTDD